MKTFIFQSKYDEQVIKADTEQEARIELKGLVDNPDSYVLVGSSG